MSKIRPRIALALGGGGARGLSHIGVLKVLEKNSIPIDIITGSSMGAIIGGAYALNPDANALEQRILALLKDEKIRKLEQLITKDEEEERLVVFKRLATFISEVYLWNLSAIKGCVMDGSEIDDLIKQLVNDKMFDDTKIKFACVATDINTGKEEILSRGNLRKAIYVSSAIPGVFPPKRIEEKLLIDGGIVTLLPAQCAKSLGADLVIGINVDKDIMPKHFKHGYDIIFRADDIRRHELNLLKMKTADIIIEPEVKTLSWAHFSKGQAIIKKGEEAAKNLMPQIKLQIKKIGLKSLIKNILHYKR